MHYLVRNVFLAIQVIFANFQLFFKGSVIPNKTQIIYFTDKI